MLTSWSSTAIEAKAKLDAVDRSNGIIEFALDGRILTANENFLRTMGYTLDEIRGQHHSLFVEADEMQSAAYAQFWSDLRAGHHRSAEYRRLGKGGREIWIEASYNPILDTGGRPYKVVKFSTDITAQITLLTDLKRIIERNFGDIDDALAISNDASSAATGAALATADTVQTMAAAAEELAASVAEISHSMAKSQDATEEAGIQVAAADRFTRQLSDAATAMGGIVGPIRTIAGQINLLALNATIESARAGEAGRGFALVAAEVKQLADQSARATERIASEIESVQAVSNQVVGALGAIGTSVGAMRDHVVSIAAAVEEQSVVTRDMSANMQMAASAVGMFAGNMRGISGSVASVTEAVGTTKNAVQVLAR